MDGVEEMEVTRAAFVAASIAILMAAYFFFFTSSFWSAGAHLTIGKYSIKIPLQCFLEVKETATSKKKKKKGIQAKQGHSMKYIALLGLASCLIIGVKCDDTKLRNDTKLRGRVMQTVSLWSTACLLVFRFEY